MARDPFRLIRLAPAAAGPPDFLVRPARPREPALVSRWLLLLAGFASLALPCAARADVGVDVVKVACAGEHSTNSVHVDDADEYPPRLQALLGAGYQVMNFGFPRATVQTENITFPNAMPYLQTMEFMASLAFAPDVVVLGPFGRHDSAANYADSAAIDRARFTAGLEAIVRAYQALPHQPTIYLALPIPFPFGTGEGVMSAVVLPATRDVAQRLNLPVIDHWNVFLGKRELFADPDHFTPDGIQRMAQVVQAAIAPGTVDGGAPSGAAPARASGCTVPGGRSGGGLAPLVVLAIAVAGWRRRGPIPRPWRRLR